MSSPAENETRGRLIEAAGEVFAEAGYRNATIRDICQRAGANVAAINYHFGGKDELYRAVLAKHFDHEVERFPIPPAGAMGGVVGGAMPVERHIEAFVFAMLSRMLDEGKPAWQAKLMVREMIEPSGEMDRVVQQYMRPHFEMLVGMLRELCGASVPEERLTLLGLSTIGQVVFYKMGREAVVRIVPELDLGPEGRRTIAGHIAEVVCAAGEELRRQFEDDRTQGKGGAR